MEYFFFGYFIHITSLEKLVKQKDLVKGICVYYVFGDLTYKNKKMLVMLTEDPNKKAPV